MTNKELQQLLQDYPDDMPIKLNLKNSYLPKDIIDFTSENILHTSKTAYIDDTAPEDEWDCEDGKFELGDGQQYLLLNAPIQ